ncbi:hypothetical protein D3C72_2452170 [compost metagenome]
MLDLNSKPSLSKIVEKLSAYNITEINSIFDQSAQSVFGSRAECGIIQMITKDKELKQSIKKTVL